jgi:phenylalanyl-tRNA synthetase beta chain
VRHALAALDYQETINYSFVEKRWEHELAGNAEPIRVLNPIAAPLAVMRSSLIGSLVRRAAPQPGAPASRVRVFEVGRVFLRDPQAVDGRQHGGRRGPAAARGRHWPTARPTRCSGAGGAGVDFYDVKGDVEALLAPRKPTFVPDAPGAAPRPLRARRARRPCHRPCRRTAPAWRQAYELPQAPVLFELELDGVLERDVPGFPAVPRQQASWRDMALVVRDGVAHDALVGALRSRPVGLVRSATLFDVYKPAQPAPASAPASAAWRCAWNCWTPRPR